MILKALSPIKAIGSHKSSKVIGIKNLPITPPRCKYQETFVGYREIANAYENYLVEAISMP